MSKATHRTACEQGAVAMLGPGTADAPSPPAATASMAGGKRAGRAAGGADTRGKQAAAGGRGQAGEAAGRDAQVGAVILRPVCFAKV